MSDWAKILDLGHDTTASRAFIKTPRTVGWAAQITGTSEKYELARTFLDEVRPGDRERKDVPDGWKWLKVPGAGLYEYRKLGDGTLGGFFLVSWRGLREVGHDDAFAQAERMR